jgi:hypothetical protein
MLILKIAGLAFWAFFAYSMGREPGGLNAFGETVAFSFFLVAPWLYLYPTYIAWQRDNNNLTSIALVNILLGWSIGGWVVAMVWAVKEPETLVATLVTERIPEIPKTDKAMKVCPYCAEEVMAAAIKCKHCGSELLVEAKIL